MMNDIDKFFAEELKALYDYFDDKIHPMNDDGINYSYQDARDKIRASRFWQEEEESTNDCCC